MTDKLKEAREALAICPWGNKTYRDNVFAINKTIRHMLTPLTDDEVEGLKKEESLPSTDYGEWLNALAYNRTIDDISKDYYLIKKGEK